MNHIDLSIEVLRQEISKLNLELKHAAPEEDEHIMSKLQKLHRGINEISTKTQEGILEKSTSKELKGLAGRPSLGITKKISLTLSESHWEWLDEKAEGNRSKFLRNMVWDAIGNESAWDNYACLGYAILGAQRIGLSEIKIKELIGEIHGEFDFKSVPEANEVYCKSDY